MKHPMQKFDEKGNVIKPKPLIKSNESKVIKKTIVKPNTIKNESKVEIGKEIKTDNITIE